MITFPNRSAWIALCLALSWSCGGNDNEPGPNDPGAGGGNGGSGSDRGRRVTLGGSVAGLQGSRLVLQNNGADDIEIGSNGAFTFSTRLTNGDSYAVTVSAQPSDPSQVCSVDNGEGTAGTSNITNIVVSCAEPGTAAPANGVLFNADDGAPDGGLSLWISGGTEETTVMLATGVQVTGGRRAAGQVMFEDEQYFVGIDSDSDTELWKTDGTPAGTQRVADIDPEGSSEPYALRVVRNHLMFFATTEGEGTEPWRSDGTEEGTTLLRDVHPGPESSVDRFELLTSTGDYAAFGADDGENGSEPWVSDGTPEGTRLLRDIAEGEDDSRAESFAVVEIDSDSGQSETRIYFLANAGRLYSTDGTGAGTVEIEGGSGMISPRYRVFDDELFIVEGAANQLKRLRVVRDGTLQTLAQRGCESGVQIERVGGPLVTERGLVFTIGWCFFLHDDSGTSKLDLEIPNPLNTVFSTIGETPLAVPITRGGSLRVADNELSDWITLPSGGVSQPSLGRMGDTLFFAAFERESGNELWKTDGTVEGTERVADINPGMADGIPRD
ncbi:MAG: hypothetical protein AAGJ56_05865 [Myxococcota bacterium]